MNNKKKVQINENIVNNIISSMKSRSDPEGSYTGVPMDENETPVQDADDL